MQRSAFEYRHRKGQRYTAPPPFSACPRNAERHSHHGRNEDRETETEKKRLTGEETGAKDQEKNRKLTSLEICIAVYIYSIWLHLPIHIFTTKRTNMEGQIRKERKRQIFRDKYDWLQKQRKYICIPTHIIATHAHHSAESSNSPSRTARRGGNTWRKRRRQINTYKHTRGSSNSIPGDLSNHTAATHALRLAASPNSHFPPLGWSDQYHKHSNKTHNTTRPRKAIDGQLSP